MQPYNNFGRFTITFNILAFLMRTLWNITVTMVILKWFNVRPIDNLSWLQVTATTWIPATIMIVVFLVFMAPSTWAWIRLKWRHFRGKEDQSC